MAPIQSQNCYSIQKSSFHKIPSICYCGSSLINDYEWWLPVSRRGHFFQDSFFEDARAHFDAAVKEVLSKWGQMVTQHHNAALSLIDNLNRYRQLQTANRLQGNLATTLVSDNNTHKIVMDVHEFMEGDIKVKVMGEKDVLVECQGRGLVSPKAFSRRFCFPETVNMTGVTSVLSSDGVLTIEAIKTSSRTGKISYLAANLQKIKNSQENALLSLTNRSEDTKYSSATSDENKVYYCKDCKMKIGPWKNAPLMAVPQGGVKIPIQINADVTKDQQASTVPSTSETTSTSQKLNNNSKIKEIKVERDGDYGNEKRKVKNIHISENNLSQNNKSLSSSGNNSEELTLSNSFNVPISTHFNTFPIIRRGLFFSDSIFDDIRKDFQSAVQEVLSKWGARSSFVDDLTCYRNLRSFNLKEENQACKITEDETSHKVLVDVQDFMDGGDITVKAINDREIVIEGHSEKKKEGSKTQKRFYKRFVLPGDIQLSSVTSIMSSDGVLTVTAPKKPSTVHLQEITIPLSIEEIGVTPKGNHVTTKTSTDASDMKMLKNICNNHEDKNGSENSSRCCEAPTLNSISTLNSLVSANTHKTKSLNEHIIPIQVEGECSHEEKTLASMKKVEQKEYQGEHTTKSYINMENSSKKSKNIEADIIKKTIHSSDTARKSESALKQTTSALKQTDSALKQTDSALKQTDSALKQTDSALKQTDSVLKQTDSALKQTDSALKQTDSSQTGLKGARTMEIKERTDSKIKGKCPTLSGCRYLPIAKRGLFFDDSFFEEYQQDFETAVNEVLVKSRENVKESEMINTYRSLRQRNLKVENQALRVHEDQNSFKVVLDVKDFTDGDINVYVEGEELVIDGRTERKEDKSSDSLTFSHRFLLPEETDFTAISTAMSSDGVLTIYSPKTGNLDANATRKMSSEVESKHESHQGGNHLWEKKNTKESSQQSKGFSSRTHCSTYHSQTQHSSKI